jgi:hypothetical protein
VLPNIHGNNFYKRTKYLYFFFVNWYEMRVHFINDHSQADPICFVVFLASFSLSAILMGWGVSKVFEFIGSFFWLMILLDVFYLPYSSNSQMPVGWDWENEEIRIFFVMLYVHFCWRQLVFQFFFCPCCCSS